MSDPTATLETSIATFAAAVRLRLDDLPVDEIDDLTGGLEADLLDQAADGDERQSLEDPESYADELRASAGLPPRSDAAPAAPTRHLRDLLGSLEARFRRAAESSKLGSWLLSFATSLLPVWWVFRGWAAYQVLAIFVGGSPSVGFPSGLLLWVLLVAAVVISVQWGRGRWAPGNLMRLLRIAVSIIAILAAPILASMMVNQAASAAAMNGSMSYVDSTGLMLDGQRVTNIFGYDAAGNPITDVQLFDQNGNPLTTVGASLVNEDFNYYFGGDATTVPHDGSARGTGWNIYPLNEAPVNDYGEANVSRAEPATPPFRTTYPVPAAAPGLTPTPTPTPTPTVEPSAAAAPTQ